MDPLDLAQLSAGDKGNLAEGLKIGEKSRFKRPVMARTSHSHFVAQHAWKGSDESGQQLLLLQQQQQPVACIIAGAQRASLFQLQSGKRPSVLTVESAPCF